MESRIQRLYRIEARLLRVLHMRTAYEMHDVKIGFYVMYTKQMSCACNSLATIFQPHTTDFNQSCKDCILKHEIQDSNIHVIRNTVQTPFIYNIRAINDRVHSVGHLNILRQWTIKRNCAYL